MFPNYDKNIICQRIIEERKRLRLSRKALAEKLSIPYQNLTNYETGLRAVPDNIKVELAYCFHVSIDYLMGIVDKEDRARTFKQLPQKYMNNKDWERMNYELYESIRQEGEGIHYMSSEEISQYMEESKKELLKEKQKERTQLKLQNKKLEAENKKLKDQLKNKRNKK